jgi:hypothetical protein
MHEAVGGDVAPGARIFRVPLTSKAQTSFMLCVVSLRFRVLPRYTQMWISTSIWVGNSGQLNRLGPSGFNGLGWIMLSLIFGPSRVDPMGLTTEKADIFPNSYPRILFCEIYASENLRAIYRSLIALYFKTGPDAYSQEQSVGFYFVYFNT